MSNSSLVTYTCLTNNNSGKRTHAIDTFTPHCTVGQVSTQWFSYFQTTKDTSCNYGIGTDGGVALCVPEDKVSWCSSSQSNDNRAVTVECASDATDPYAFNSKVYNKLIELCVDVCRRNGKTKVVWIPDKNKALSYNRKNNEMLITVHRWFANKECPGDWLMGKMSDFASKVNAKLGAGSIQYRVHAQDKGWFPWVSDGACAGTTGEARRLEAIQIKSEAANLTYQVHVQNKGDMPPVGEGQTAGTTGQSLRMEAIKIDCNKPITYRVHVQNKGWMPWVKNGQWAGTKGQGLRMEAIEIKFA